MKTTAGGFITGFGIGYSFGLFSYIYEDPSGQAFEVLNYTVTPQANAAP